MCVVGSTLQDVDALIAHREWFKRVQFDDIYQPSKNHYLFDCELNSFRKFYWGFLRRINMANAKINDKKYKFKGFANINITADHQQQVEKYCADNEQVWQHYIMALNEGIAIKSVYDAKNEAYRCTLTAMDMSSENGGLSMSAFADDPFFAIGVAMYKHFIISEREWESFVGSDNRKFG